MEWNNTNERIPPATDRILGHSDVVLCQDGCGNTFLGYVRHDMNGEFDPVWTQKGRDMYAIHNVVKWILLKDILSQIHED